LSVTQLTFYGLKKNLFSALPILSRLPKSSQYTTSQPMKQLPRRGLRVSEEGIRKLKTWEGFEANAYQDIASVWTIGYGHTGEAAKPGASITEPEAHALLLSDLAWFEGRMNILLEDIPTAQHEFDAMCLLMYNIGHSAFKRSSVFRYHSAGDKMKAAESFLMWRKATVDGVKKPVWGLFRRRFDEGAMYCNVY